MATHSSILAWRIPWTEEPGGLQGHKGSDTTEQLSTYACKMSLLRETSFCLIWVFMRLFSNFLCLKIIIVSDCFTLVTYNNIDYYIVC